MQAQQYVFFYADNDESREGAICPFCGALFSKPITASVDTDYSSPGSNCLHYRGAYSGPRHSVVLQFNGAPETLAHRIVMAVSRSIPFYDPLSASDGRVEPSAYQNAINDVARILKEDNDVT